MKVGIFSKKILDVYIKNNYSFEAVRLKDWNDAGIEEVDSLVIGRMSNEEIDKCSNLKDIYIPFTGKNGFNEVYLNEKGITLHTTNSHSKFVAERALALTLTFLGKIIEYNNKLKEGNWSKRNFDERISWESLFNKRIGIYGYGTIGKWISKMTEAFNCEVYAYNRSREENVKYVDTLEELVEKTDIVFICVPFTKETEGSIGRKILAKMEKKLLVNVARGKIVNEEELYKALKNKTLYGYASDVWFNYPASGSDEMSPSNYPLNEERVLMTPHCGGFTVGAEEERYIDILNQIEQSL